MRQIELNSIVVATHDGIVTLSGTVPTYAEKWTAQKATQRVEGVKAIAEQLKVQPAAEFKRKESEIAESVVNSLKWHVWVPNVVQATHTRMTRQSQLPLNPERNLRQLLTKRRRPWRPIEGWRHASPRLVLLKQTHK